MPHLLTSAKNKEAFASLQREMLTINAKFAADKTSHHLWVTSCTSGSDQKWQSLPVGATVWKVK